MKNPTENRPDPIDEYGECTPETWIEPPSESPSDRRVVIGWDVPAEDMAKFLAEEREA